jgi:hypothetical protein
LAIRSRGSRRGRSDPRGLPRARSRNPSTPRGSRPVVGAQSAEHSLTWRRRAGERGCRRPPVNVTARVMENAHALRARAYATTRCSTRYARRTRGVSG